MDTRMYVMTHKKICEIPEKNYIPLQVGKKGKENFGYIGDDTGDNISEKNPFYCELTGMYWIWKNVQCDIVGICHYRRFFGKNQKLMKSNDMEKALKKYDILIPKTLTTNEENVYEHYAVRHHSKDLDLCREVIEEKYPEYLAAFDYTMLTNLISMGNMWITHKGIYDSYCEWLFGILFEVEKRIDLSTYEDYQKRVFGFLSERLFRVWLIMQSRVIGEEEIIQMEIEGLDAEKQKKEIFYRYIKARIEPVLQLRQSGVKETLALPFSCSDDFNEKIPVWICWWQGENDIPEVVRYGIESIKRYISQEKMELRLITLENCITYVSFSENIIRKFNEGKISIEHLKDITKAELLYRYGGMWIESGYFMANSLPAEAFDTDLYTLSMKNVVEEDITEGIWNSEIWYTKKQSPLFSFLLDSLLYYWEIEDKLVTEKLEDYIIAVAKSELPEVQRLFEKGLFGAGDVLQIHTYAGCKHVKERTTKLLEQSVFHKLDIYQSYSMENIVGEQTLYGYLLQKLKK